MLIVLMSCAFALLVAGGVQTAFELFTSRRTFIRDLSTLGQVPRFEYDRCRRLQGRQGRDRCSERYKSESRNPISRHLDAGRLALCQVGEAEGVKNVQAHLATAGVTVDGLNVRHFQPIILDGERIGMLYLRSHFGHELLHAFEVESLTFGGATAVALLLAFIISKRLQTAISGPVRKLADTASEIAARKDYSVRAEKFESDEVGALTDSFNHMLDEIQRQDGELRHEIEERVRAEQEVDQLHKQVLATSRQAGMAEVATGVLHNVGNVLNSVNISTALLTEHVKKSRIQNVGRLAELLRSHDHDLAEFLTSDPKGRALPGYVAELGQRLESERVKMLAEIEALGANIEHIKEIVAMQQNYAKVHGVTETLPLLELVEDAMRMNAAAFVRHGVTLERDFADIPPVTVDKHKVLQVLTNLLRNAKYAVDEIPIEPKLVRVSIRADAEGFALVIVRDNGVGIPPENLTRIFGHGFTTRRDGHGFGLHSGALAAKEMGGRLHVHSDGLGAGAVFTLALPLAVTRPLPNNGGLCQSTVAMPIGAF